MDMNKKNGTILIVDDNPKNRKILSVLLEPEGYLVIEAVDGADALEKVAQSPPDTILLDVMMPKIDGFEVCRRLKQAAATAHIPILLVTMLHERQDRLKGIAAGADDFLSKPVDIDETRLRVHNAISTKRLFDENLAFRHELERKVKERTRDLEKAFADLKVSQELIIQQEKLASIGQLAAGVAHEVNNPTGFISSNLSTLAKYTERLTEYMLAEAGALQGQEDQKVIDLKELRKKLKIDFILEDIKDLVKESLEGTDSVLVLGLDALD